MSLRKQTDDEAFVMNGAITRSDVEEIVAKNNQIIEQGIAHLTKTLENESIARREESKALNHAMVKMANSLSQTHTFVKVYDERLAALRKAQATEILNNRETFANFRDMYDDHKQYYDRRINEHSNRLAEAEREQTKNTTRINVAWSVSGIILTLAISGYATLFHQGQEEKEMFRQMIQAIGARNDVMADGLHSIEKAINKGE